MEYIQAPLYVWVREREITVHWQHTTELHHLAYCNQRKIRKEALDVLQHRKKLKNVKSLTKNTYKIYKAMFLAEILKSIRATFGKTSQK